MNSAFAGPMTQDAFFRWADRQERGYEFDGVRPVPMNGGSVNHARITGNINVALNTRLDGNGPCEALMLGAGVETIGKSVRYPDGLVTCTPFDGRERLIPNPVIVEQNFVGCTVLWRHENEPWRFETLKGGDVLVLPEIGAEMPIDDLYARVTFAEDQSSG